MTTAAKLNFNNELWMISAGGSLVKIAELLSVSPPKPQRATVDVTTHDSTGEAQEFISEGTYDPGEISFTGHYIASSTGDAAMMTALTTGAKQDFKVVEKGSALIKTTGSGYLTSYGPDDQPVQGKQTFSATFKVTGALTKAANS